jgi:hypothetical protein
VAGASAVTQVSPANSALAAPLNKPFVDPEPVFIGSLCYYRTALIKMFQLATNSFVESHP